MLSELPGFDVFADIMIRAAPSMPSDAWFMTTIILGLLIATAVIDAYKAIIPDPLILLGLICVTAARGFFGSWDDAAFYLRYAILVGFSIWFINFIWYHRFRHDALGMGDAKWTMLVVSCFGGMAALYAWGVGSILAVLFIGLSRLLKHSVRQVPFAPFLCIGLGCGLYWLRLRG